MADGRVLGIGGVFLRSPNPKALRDWYARVLGLEVSPWGGVKFGPLPKGSTTWSPHEAASDHFEPSTREAMVNFVVEDLDALLARAEREGAEVLGRQDADAFGRFAWLLDPDGYKVELWEPKA